VIESGKELFGNFTPQPLHPNPQPNGFLALAEYDMPSNGGNLDTVIDSQDSVWPRLKIWIDEHCYQHPQETCVSRPEELHALSEFHIDSISVVYSLSDKVDDNGNEFRYYALINPDKTHSDLVHHPYHHKYKYNAQHSGRDDRKAYDVYLLMN